MTAVPAVRMTGITKAYGPTVANAGVDFDLSPGEIHVLLGENGAGKSTLIGILAGMQQPDAGDILIDGKAVTIASPRARSGTSDRNTARMCGRSTSR